MYIYITKGIRFRKTAFVNRKTVIHVVSRPGQSLSAAQDLPFVSSSFRPYFDTTPPFGCRTSALACASTTSPVVSFCKMKASLHCVTMTTLQEQQNHIQRQSKHMNLYYHYSWIQAWMCHIKNALPRQLLLGWLGFDIDMQDLVIKMLTEKLTSILQECEILEFLRKTPFRGKVLTTQQLISDIMWFMSYAKQSNGLVLIKPMPK